MISFLLHLTHCLPDSLAERQGELLDELGWLDNACCLQEGLSIGHNKSPFVLVVCEALLKDVPGQEGQVDGLLVSLQGHGTKSLKHSSIVSIVSIDARGKGGARGTRPVTLRGLALEHRSEVWKLLLLSGCG